MKLTINSRTMRQAVVFSRPGGGYIYVDRSGDGSRPGSLGEQICAGGRLIGQTISYSGSDEAGFARICRTWLRAYLRDTGRGCLTPARAPGGKEEEETMTYAITIRGKKVAEITANDAEAAARAYSENCGPDTDFGFVRGVRMVDAETRGKTWAILRTDADDITAERI